MVKVSELIKDRTHVFSVCEQDTVHNAARYLREKAVRAVGVCDNAGALVGVISQSDISDKVAAENRCPAWIKVSEIMSQEMVRVSPETGFDQCLHLMERNGIYHLLVADQEGRFYGMISVQDLLQAFADDQKSRADMLEAYIFTNK
ncbi:MAG: CBS domain-containing protein [Acidobacteria bacterium]|nr:CBS domain-containing protein [Acidobacteriota bacterium]MBI3658157.1 CBS domain-containing protein [Acidobacteriota bacterium]